MADLERAVAIIFNAVDNTGGTITNIGKSISDFSGGLDDAIAPLDSLADKVKLADAAIIGLGLALGGAALIKAGEFGDQINEIGTLFGGTAEEISQFGAEVQAYAANSTKSLEDINGAIYAAVSAGISYKDSLAFMAEAEKLSIAGKADLASTTVALVSTLNAFGASTEEAAKYSDIFFQTVKLGQTTLPELAGSLAQVTGVASAAGIDFEALAAAIAALTAYGLPTSQAITGIKAAISNIIKPTKDASDAADELGLKFDSNALKSKGFAGVLDEVYKATNGNVGEMGRFFGSVEALNVALTLGGDKADKYSGSIEGMANSAGATSKAFDTMEANFALAVQKMKNGVDLLLISIGQPLQDEFADLAGAFGDVFKNLKVSVDAGAFAPIFAVLGDVEDDLTAFISKIAAALPEALEKVDFTKFVDGINALTGGLGSIFEGLDLDTPEGLAETIQMIADASGNLLAQGGGIAESWGTVIKDVILPAVEAFARMSTEMSKSTGEALGWSDALAAILPIFTGIGDGLKGVGDGLSLLSGAFFAAIFKTMIPAIEAFGLASLSKSGIVGVFLIIAEVLGKLVAGEGPIEMAAKALYRLATSGDDSSKELAKLESTAKAGAAEVQNLGDKADASATGMQKSATAIEQVKEVTMAMALAAGVASTKADFLAAAQANLAKPTKETAAAMAAAADAYKTTALTAGTAAEASKVIRSEYDKLAPAAEKVNDKLKTSSGVLETLASKTDLTNQELIELAKVTKDAEVKLEALASNERIKLIEAEVKLNIADIEANAKVAVAILDNISQTYTADTGLIGDLMAQVTDGYTLADRTRITLVQASNERVEELHGAQLELIAAQVEYMRAKTDATSQGNPLVTIQADGLKPHLEAFMWEILGAIQVKMAYDGGDMLVGGCSL